MSVANISELKGVLFHRSRGGMGLFVGRGEREDACKEGRVCDYTVV